MLRRQRFLISYSFIQEDDNEQGEIFWVLSVGFNCIRYMRGVGQLSSAIIGISAGIPIVKVLGGTFIILFWEVFAVKFV